MKRSARFVFAMLVCAQCALSAFADNYPRDPSLDAIHYRLNLSIKDGSDEIKAEAEILFEFKREGVKTIALDLASLTVDQVTENQQEAKFTHSGGKLTVTLSGAYHS